MKRRKHTGQQYAGFCCILGTIMSNIDFYDLKFKTPHGKEISMSDYQGKLVLIINTATKCGFAKHFDGLEKLHQKYKGLVVLGFPSDTFHQEPESNDSVENVCKLNFGVTFQLSEKIAVNGRNEHPVYAYLKSRLRGRIKWNFTKFLISSSGKPLKRYSPTTKPETIEKDIKKYLG